MDLTARKGTEDLSPRIGDAADSHLSDAVLNGAFPRMGKRVRGEARSRLHRVSLPRMGKRGSGFRRRPRRFGDVVPLRCRLWAYGKGRGRRDGWAYGSFRQFRNADTPVPGAWGFSSIRKPPLTASEGYSRGAGSFAAEVRFHDLADGILPERGGFRVHDRLTAFRAAGLRFGMTS